MTSDTETPVGPATNHRDNDLADASAFQERSLFRAWAMGALLLAVLAGAAGLTARALFATNSSVKQALTVAVPAGLIWLLATRRPLVWLTGATLVAAPLDLVVTVGGIGISPLDALLAIGWPAAYAVSERRSRYVSRVGLAAVAAAAAAAVPLVNSANAGEFLHLFVTVALVGYLVAREARDGQARVFLLRALVISAALQAALALYEVATGRLLDLYSATGSVRPQLGYFFGFETTFRPAGTLPDPIALGNVLAAGLVLAVAAVVTSPTVRHRAVWASCGGLIALALVFSLSRTSWIGAVIGIAVLLVSLPRRQGRSALLGLLLGAVLVLGIAYASDGTALLDRYRSISNPTAATNSTATSDKTRLEIWRADFVIIDQHPAFGVGFGHIRDALYGKVQGAGPGIHAHSTYFNVLAEAGLVGGGGLLLLLLATLRDGIAQLRFHRGIAAGVLGSLVAVLVGWTTDYTMRNLSVAAFVAAIVGLAARPGDRARYASSAGSDQTASANA